MAYGAPNGAPMQAKPADQVKWAGRQSKLSSQRRPASLPQPTNLPDTDLLVDDAAPWRGLLLHPMKDEACLPPLVRSFIKRTLLLRLKMG